MSISKTRPGLAFILYVPMAASVAGACAGVAESIYRAAPAWYGGLLYGSIGVAMGIGIALAFMVLRLFYSKDFLGAGPGPGAWAFCLTVMALTMVLLRFILFRDVLLEAPGSGLKATVTAAVAAVLLGGMALYVGRLLRHLELPMPWLPPLLLLSSFAVVVMTDAGADTQQAVHTEPTQLQGRGVILVVVDTLRADVLGAYGGDAHRGAPASPHIDAFANKSVVFDNVSAQASWTRPAVASIMTSRHVSGHQTMAKTARLPNALPTIATHLRAAGIQTGAVVTNYNLEETFGFARGYNAFSYLAPARYLGAPKAASRLAFYNVYRLVREKLWGGGRASEHFYRSAAEVNAAGFDMLNRMAKKPDDRFFLWLHYMEPHDPYFPAPGVEVGPASSYARVAHRHPNKSWAAPMRAAYRDDVRRFDEGFGALLEGLSARGLADNTSVVLVADHGEEFFEHGGYYHGVTLFEEQLHVPLIISRAGREAESETAEPRQNRIKGLARQVDVAPTISALFELPSALNWEGRDLFGDAPWPGMSLAEEDHEGNILRSVSYGEDPITHKRYKLILANEGNPRGLRASALYDLLEDPTEQSPIEGPEDEKRLTSALEAAQSRSQKGGARAGHKELSADDEAELRALGYIQ